MHPAILPAALAFSASAAMAFYVATRREQTDLHRLLVAVLAAVMLWTCGVIFRFSVETEAGLHASLRLIFLGVFTVPPLWLMLAASYARLRMVRHRQVWIAISIPSLLAYLGLLTNEGHQLMLREVSFEALTAGGRAWAGPGFWTFLVWAYVCVLGGVGIHLHTARRMVLGGDRRRGFLLALFGAIPLASSAIYVFRIFPVPFDLTPTALAFSLVLLSAAVFRYRLLESLPLARRDVIEHLRDAVLIANLEGSILDLNPAAERMLGQSARDLRGQPLAGALSELVQPAGRETLREILEHLESRSIPLETRLHTVDDRWLSLSAALAHDVQGGAAGQFAVLRDRTDEHRYERVVRQTQRLETVGTLAAGIAHEVNNPLAFIGANLRQMQRMGEVVEEHRDPPDAKLAEELADLREIAAETLDGIGRIERIISDMRRLTTDGETPFHAVDLNEVVRDTLRLADLNRAADVEIRASLHEPLPEVDGAPERLVQALLNLVVNAKQALAGLPDPRIEVSTRVEGRAVRVTVRDNGPGIDVALHERIFDPFFTTKGPDHGTGLGLSIAFDILRDHGGVLEVDSRPGEGTTFAALVPVR